MTDHDLRRERQEREALRQELESGKPLHYFGKYNGPEVDLLARISEAGQPAWRYNWRTRAWMPIEVGEAFGIVFVHIEWYPMIDEEAHAAMTDSERGK